MIIEHAAQWANQPRYWVDALIATFEPYWTFLVGLSALVGAYFTYRQTQITKQAASGSHKQPRIRLYPAQKLAPANFVGAFAVGTKRYFPISKDQAIADAVELGNDLLIIGRGGIGKSHAAVQHIRQFAHKHRSENWKVILLDRFNLGEIRGSTLPRGNYIIFFDDLDHYISGNDSYDFFDAIGVARERAQRLRIIGTVRSTSPEFDAVGTTRAFSRFSLVLLEDWNTEQRDALLSETGVDPAFWDGTPLSGKQPSSEMEHRAYRNLPYLPIQVLACAKVCNAHGLQYVRKELLRALVKSLTPQADESMVAISFEAIERAGFLKQSDEAIQVYSPYYDFISADHDAIWRNLCAIMLNDPGHSKELFRVARMTYLTQDYGLALNLFKGFVKHAPEVEAGHYRLGLTHMRLKQWSAAIDSFKTAVEIAPGFASALFQLAVAYDRANQKELSKATRLKAIAATASATPTLLLQQGEMLLASNEPKEALTFIELSLERDPCVRHGWGLKGQAHLRLGEIDLAETAFEKAVGQNPDAFVYFGLGQVARRRKDWGKAEEHFRKAVEMLPEFAQAHSLLGQALQRKGDSTEAVASFKKAIELGATAAHFGIGLIYHRQKDWENAAKHFEAATIEQPSLALAYSYLGTSRERLGDQPAALEAHKKASELAPDDKNIWSFYAAALKRNDQTEAAKQAYLKCLEIDPSFAAAVEGLNSIELRPNN